TLFPPNAGRPNEVAALVDIDLVIEPSEFVSLIGPSGCGKSTQLRLIANLLEPTSGEIFVNGKPARKARLDQDYGMAFQQAGLFDWRNVVKNVELPPRLKGWGRAGGRRRGSRCAWARQAARVRRPLPVAARGRHAAGGRGRARSRRPPAAL